MATFEGCWEVVSFEYYCIIFYVIVEIHYFVRFQELEWIFNKISLIAFQLDVWDLDVVYEADYLIEELVFSLVKHL